MSSTPSKEPESFSEALFREWERARARSGSPLILPSSYIVGSAECEGDSVNVTIWGSGSSQVTIDGSAGGSGGSVSVYGGAVRYWSDDSTGVQMVLSDGHVAQPFCQHDLVVPVNLLYTFEHETVSYLCELCGEQLPLSFEAPVGPASNAAKDICNQYGEKVARWTTESGEWIIVRE